MADTDTEKSDAEEVPDDGAYVGVAPEYQNAAYEQNRPQFGDDPVEVARSEYEVEHAEALSTGVGIHGYTNSSNVGAQPTKDQEGAGREIVFDAEAPENQKGTAPLEGDALEAAVADDEDDEPEPEEKKPAAKSTSGGGGGGKTTIAPPD